MAQLKSGSIIIGKGTILDSDEIGISLQGYNADTVIDASYVHTDNNYTTTEKNKLADIASGAEVNTVDSVDGNTGAVDLSSTYEPKDITILKDADIGVNIQAYDGNIVSDASYVHTDNNYTTTEKTKLSGIEEGAVKITLGTEQPSSGWWFEEIV